MCTPLAFRPYRVSAASTISPQKERSLTNWKQNLAIACVLLPVDAYFLINSLSYPSDSNTFPLLLSILLGITVIVLGAQALFAARLAGNVPFVKWRHYHSVGRQIVLIAIFALIAPFIGYLIAGFLLCFATACNGGYPDKKIAFVFSIGVSIFVFAIFRLILQVSLPLGFFMN
jgi:hypothetical protein